MEPKNEPVSADWHLIVNLGGPAKVAKLLGYEMPGGMQRVHNWKTRGIPASVKVEHPDLFMAAPWTRRKRPTKPRAAGIDAHPV